MKKINYILAACAVATVMFFASCKQPTEMVDVTNVSNSKDYTVTGTITNVTKTVISGTSGSTTEITDKYEIKRGRGTLSWSESKNTDSNYQQYKLLLQCEALETSTVSNGSTSVTTTADTTSTTDERLVLYKIDDKFYYDYKNEFISVGEIDVNADSFILSFTTSSESVVPSGSETETKTTTDTWNLTFTAK